MQEGMNTTYYSTLILHFLMIKYINSILHTLYLTEHNSYEKDGKMQSSAK